MFTLIDLPYSDLAPVISAGTLSFHHGKHLRGYVDTLNKLIAGTEFENAALEDIIRKAPAGLIFNNAGQILNHELYFRQFRPGGAALADGALKVQIEKQWGSLDAFQAEFVQKGATLFGSGWVWLAAAADGTLQILQCPGADNPVAHGLRPVLTFDVWEHAYYLDWQNRRPDHLKALWGIVDWKVVGERFEK